MNNNEQLPRFEPLLAEEAQYVRTEINTLREKDWTPILIPLNFEGDRLEHASAIVHAFCLGVADTIEDQLKRNKIPSGYIFPRVAVVSSVRVASFNRHFDLIKISMEDLSEGADYNENEIANHKLAGKVVLVSGNLSKLYYHFGNEEAKHSIDFHRGKMELVEDIISSLEYHAQLHEYLALGEKALRAKKRGDTAAFSSFKNFLTSVIKYRREKRLLELDKKERLTHAVLEVKAYTELCERWTSDEVLSYLQQIAPDTAAKTMSDIKSATPAGFGVDFHERFEMSRLAEIIDGHWGDGTFRKKLAEKKLEEVEFYEESDNNQRKKIYPYAIAHPEAMRAEVAFLQQIAKELGFPVSRTALFIAKPNMWDDFGRTTRTIESFYTVIRPSNLVRRESDEHPDYPMKLLSNEEEDVLLAEKFFVEYGNAADYPVLPSEIIRRNGFLDQPRS